MEIKFYFKFILGFIIILLTKFMILEYSTIRKGIILNKN